MKPKAMGKISSIDDNNDYQENSRKMLPIRLSWALTIWKEKVQSETKLFYEQLWL